MDIQKRIKDLQKKRGLSINKLALEADVSPATIIAWYTKNITPTIKALEGICNAFGMTMCEFFNETNMRVSLTEQEEELLKQFALLRLHEKEDLLKFITDLNERVNIDN